MVLMSGDGVIITRPARRVYNRRHSGFRFEVLGTGIIGWMYDELSVHVTEKNILGLESDQWTK